MENARLYPLAAEQGGVKLLFVSNGHGEEAIAARIAQALKGLAPVAIDHLALVGNRPPDPHMRPVGPRSRMPSGGLIAMGNIRNIVSDVRAGLVSLTVRQYAFLIGARHTYDFTVAVGDIFALTMARACGSPLAYVGTAKSIHVAPYGWLERQILQRTRLVFVRDEATACALRRFGIAAQAPGNVIVDMSASDTSAQVAQVDENVLALFPGSRQSAYHDALFLAAVVREVARARGDTRALLSIAPGLNAGAFADALRADRWIIRATPRPQIPFEALLEGRPILQAWTGPFSALLHDATLVLGQAGTANEAAAAAGVPIVAFEEPNKKGKQWYRLRQVCLLDGAMEVIKKELPVATATVLQLLRDDRRRSQMSKTGRERMGPPGGALAIARHILTTLDREHEG